MLGAAPHSQMCRDREVDYPGSRQSRTRALCNREADRRTHLRVAALPRPCSLACFYFFFRELPLLTRSRPAQPLLLTADSAGSSVFLSPIGVTIAAARPCMFIQCVSAKECVSGLCQVRRLHMLILAAIMCASQGEKSSF